MHIFIEEIGAGTDLLMLLFGTNLVGKVHKKHYNQFPICTFLVRKGANLRLIIAGLLKEFI